MFRFATLLLTLLTTTARADFETKTAPVAAMDRTKIWDAVNSGQLFHDSQQRRLDAFDALPEAARNDYAHWKTDILGIPLQRTRTNYLNRVQLSYAQRCLSFEQIRRGQLKENLPAKLMQDLARTRDPLEEGGTVDYLNSRATNTCVMQRYRSIKNLIAPLRQTYFPESANAVNQYYFIGNVKHAQAGAFVYYTARIARGSLVRALFHRAKFDDSPASHAQIRLQFDQDILLRRQGLERGTAPLAQFLTRELIFSVEVASTTEDNQSHSYTRSILGAVDERDFSFKGTSFTFKTATAGVADAILTRKDPRSFPVYQYPIQHTANAKENRIWLEGLLKNIFGASEAHGMHTSYNLIRRHCGSWPWAIVQAHLGRGSLGAFDIHARIPDYIPKALADRSLGVDLAPAKANTYLRYQKDASNLAPAYLFWLDEICAQSPERFKALKCSSHPGPMARPQK